MSFPRHDCPTGKIIAGPYLGKASISKSFYKEGPDSVDSRIASAYYAADWRSAINEIKEILESGYNLILDRYVSSNMAHQGGKIKDPEERVMFYKDLDLLEHKFMKLPLPDLTFFLYMPIEISFKLKKDQLKEDIDGHESDINHLINARDSYLELCRIYNWKKIDCAPDGTINSLKTPEKIHEELWCLIKEYLEKS